MHAAPLEGGKQFETLRQGVGETEMKGEHDEPKDTGGEVSSNV